MVRVQDGRGWVAAPAPSSVSPHATTVADVLLTHVLVVSGSAEQSSSDASVPLQLTSASATGRLAGSTCMRNGLVDCVDQPSQLCRPAEPMHQSYRKSPGGTGNVICEAQYELNLLKRTRVLPQHVIS